MLVIEQLLEPADVSALAELPCAACGLSQDLTGSEVGLSRADSQPTRLEYMQGGTAISQCDLAAAPPRGPAPGVILDPPSLAPGDTGFLEDQRAAEYYCNKCGQGAQRPR